MNECIFAIVDHGNYDDYEIEFIKISNADKEKFTQYCRQGEAIHGGEESLSLHGWAKDVEAIVVNSSCSTLNIFTIHEHQERIMESVRRIDEMKEHNYLYDKRDMVNDLLKYEFLEV